jgi:hypothetical protein
MTLQKIRLMCVWFACCGDLIILRPRPQHLKPLVQLYEMPIATMAARQFQAQPLTRSYQIVLRQRALPP